MGKNSLKMRIMKTQNDQFAVQQLIYHPGAAMRVWEILSDDATGSGLAIYPTIAECVQHFPCKGVINSAKRFGVVNV